MRSLLSLAVLSFTAVSLWPPSTAVASACEELFADAAERRDVGAVARIARSERARALCDYDQLWSVRDPATAWLAREAAVVLRGGDLDGAEAMIESAGGTGLVLTDHWRVNALLGEIAMERERWGEAAEQYGEAYRRLVGREQSGTESFQLALFERASEAQMLAGELSPAVARGEDSLLGSRGAKPREIPLPIQFEFGEAVFSDKGRASIRVLERVLINAGHDEIELIGHTDPVDDRALNQRLSEQRVQAVAEVIRTAFERVDREPPRMKTRGDGETCPPRLSDPGRFTVGQHDEMARRVTIVLEPDVPSSLPRCGPKVPGRDDYDS